MKLKNRKQGDKKVQTQKQQPKVEVEQKTNFDDEEQRDDALIDIKEDLKKKQQIKPKVSKRIETNKLQQTQIDASKIMIQKKEEEKKVIQTWVVNASEVQNLVKADFKLNEVDHEFQSLTDTKINEELRQKKQKRRDQNKPQSVGQMKFAPIVMGGGNSALQNKNTEKLTFGKPKTQTQTIPFTTTPVLNFTNSKINQNIQTTPIQKSAQQLAEEQADRKIQQRQQQRPKVEEQPKAKLGWFKKTTNEPVKQAPKIEFKASNLTFTNSALNSNNSKNDSTQQSFKGFKPLQKTKQEQLFERKEQQFKFTNKKEVQERRKKREEQQLLLQQPKVQTTQKV